MRIFFVSVILFFVSACATQQILTPYDRTSFSDGEFKWITDRDMAIQVKDPAHDVVTWWVDATLDDNTFIGIDFSLGKPVKGADGKPLIHINIIEPGKKPINIWKFYTHSSEFWASSERLDVKIGKSRLWGTYPDFYIEVYTDEFSCFLKLNANFQSGMLESNEVWFGDKLKFGWIIPVPLGKIDGWMEINGNRRSVSGTGYHDHGWGNGPFHKVVDSWYWFHAQNQKDSLLVATYTTSKKFNHKPVNLLMYFNDNKLVTVTDNVKIIPADFEYNTTAKRIYPKTLTVLLDDKDAKGSIKLTCKSPADVIDLMEGVNPVLSSLYRLFIGSPASFMTFPDISGNIVKSDKVYPLDNLKTTCHIIYFK